MSRTKKRKPDLRRIRPTKTYLLPEIAETLDRNLATMRAWVREGLPTLDDKKPIMVLGAVLKAWLKKKWEARKQKCQSDELYCCRCRKPRKPEPVSIRIIPKNEKTVSIKGWCSICGSRMNRTGSRANIAEIKDKFGTPTPLMPHLSGCSNASVKNTFEPNTVSGAFGGARKAQTALNRRSV